jgi:hypothetical protein
MHPEKIEPPPQKKKKKRKREEGRGKMERDEMQSPPAQTHEQSMENRQ